MKINALPLFALLALGGLSSQLSAADRADVLERIAPVGKVNVAGQAAPAAAAPASETAAAGAAATDATTPEAAAAETPAAETTAAAEAAPAAATPAAPAADDPMALAQQSGCLACHQVETKVVGPAYKDVAAKYKGDAGALDRLVAKVKSGGSGTWGPVPMPPNVQVSEENIRTIVSWVLSL